jgi:hypothetical protein
MKKIGLRTFVLFLFCLFPWTLSDCKKNQTEGSSKTDLAIVDVQQETGWDYWVVGKSGDYFYLKIANSIPEKVLMHVQESNVDIPIIFNQEGFPEKVIIGDYIFIFENHKGVYLDMAVVFPNGEIQTATNIKTDIDWDQIKTKNVNALESTSSLIRWAARAVGAVPCAISIGATVISSGAALPLAIWKCGNYVLKLAADITENEFATTNGFTNFVKTWGYATTITSCSGALSGNPDAAISCLSSLASTSLGALAVYEGTLDQKSDKTSEATSILLTGSVQLFSDGFDANLNNWTLFGSPLPIWVSSVFGQSGVFDNNGDPNYNSGAISKQAWNLSRGFTLSGEVYLDYSNPTGCWAGASIGLADPLYQSWGGYNSTIYLGFSANGDACWASPSGTFRHAILYGGYLSSTGAWESFGDLNVSPIYVDSYLNKWQTIKIVVGSDNKPCFYIGGTLFYKGTNPLSSQILSRNNNIFLGERSSGSAGKAYHNWIKLSTGTK